MHQTNIYNIKRTSKIKHGINNLFRKSNRVKSEYRVRITAGVSAQGSGHPPILDYINPAIKIGVTGNFNCLIIVKDMKVNNKTTLRLFINNDVAYITKGRTIIINIFSPFERLISLSPIAFNSTLFSKILENNARVKISSTISNGNDLKAATVEYPLNKVVYINNTPIPKVAIAVRYFIENIIPKYIVRIMIIIIIKTGTTFLNLYNNRMKIVLFISCY